MIYCLKIKYLHTYVFSYMSYVGDIVVDYLVYSTLPCFEKHLLLYKISMYECNIACITVLKYTVKYSYTWVIRTRIIRISNLTNYKCTYIG